MFLIKTKTFHYDFLWRVSLSLLSLPPSAGLESKPRDRNLKGMNNCRLRAVGLECVWYYLLYIAPSSQCVYPPGDSLGPLLLASLPSWRDFGCAPVYRVLWKEGHSDSGRVAYKIIERVVLRECACIR